MLSTVLVVNPNPLLSLVHEGSFQPGCINRVSRLSVVAEGKGVNVARVLARHGHGVSVAGFAGGHSGAWLRELVRAEGIHDAFVATAAPLRVGFMAGAPEADHPTTWVPTGFPVTAAECEALLQRVADRLGHTRLVIASGSVPDPAAENLYADILALCAARDVPCWLDAYGPAMHRALAGQHAPRLCAPNREEFAENCRWERVEELHVTDGAAAVEVRSWRDGCWRVRPPRVRQVNPVGSGDCYLAGLAHGWLQGLAFESCLRYAAAAGAANAMRQGVATLTPQDIAPLLAEVAVDALIS